MKTGALKKHPRFPLYKLVRKWVQRRELQPVVFDTYIGSRLSLEDALDDYLKFHLEDIKRDLAMLLRNDRDQRVGWGC